jgi:outer membrane protein
VNKFLLSASAVAALAITLSASSVFAQASRENKPATPAASAPAAGATAASSAPHKVALIDMAYVFKNYEKFNALREDLKAEVTNGEEQAKQKAEVIKNLQAKLKSFQENSPEFTKTEEQLARATADFEAFRRAAQRDFLKKESQIYHTVYMDVSDLVKRYAEHYNYTLVMRFSREELDTENAQKLIEGMNRQVVYFRTEDDITDVVTDVLNRNYKNAAKTPATPGSAAPRTSPATTVKPPGTTNR